jgi:glycine oxidase
LAAGARRRGATVVPGAELRAVDTAGPRVVRALVGGDWVAPGSVVVAAGAWSGRLPGIPSPCAIVPARGQMLALRPPAASGGPTVSHAGGYLVPQPSGEVLVGATVERAGFTRAVTPAGIGALLDHVRRVAPGAGDWPVVRMWAGLRPEAPGGGPWIGRHPRVENVVVATGHHRNGILLAPVTAAVVSSLLDGAAMPPEVAGFGGG